MLQSVEAGANADGYTVSEVDVYLVSGSGRSTSVSIRENNASDKPGALVATLTNPGTLTSNSLNTFTAPAGTTLAASKTYWITTNEGISSNRANVGRVGGGGQIGEPGWTIGNDSLFRTAETSDWDTSGNILMIEIRGTSGGYTASTDATLSDLALEDGDGIAIPLAFASDDYEYEVSVVNGIDAVTLSATKNDSNAMVVITNDDDQTGSPEEAVLDLSVGPNTLTVTVTAEDGSTELIYTVTVTRAVPPDLVVSASSLTVGEAGSGTFTVKLATQPSGSVTVSVTSDDTGAATASPASLLFTTADWNTVQTVTVSGVDDSDTAPETVTVSLNAAGGGYGSKTGSVSVSVTDDDITTTDVTLSGTYIRSILVPYDLDLGEKALPEEELDVWVGYPFYKTIHVVAEGDRWSPSGIWGDPVQDMIWVVDPIHFGIHALKLSALKDGRIERHIAANTSEFDYRFNYNCHFRRLRASGDHGNPALTVMWGNDSTIWVVNDESSQLDAYSRNGSLTTGCHTENVTAYTLNGPTTAREDFKTPFTRDTNRDYSLQTGDGPLTVRGIWSNGMKIWVSGPPGNIYTIDMGDGQVVEAPGFDGHYDAYGLWSDGTTMWVATRGRLRAYDLNTGVRHAALDVQLRGNHTPGDMWSDGTTIWITYRSGSIEVYRLPERSGGVSQATEAEPLTASFASAPEGHDGESGFTFRIAFSEEVEITPEDMRDHALLVSGGTVTDAAGVDGRKDLWELTVEPISTGTVSISVLQGLACTETGALCTADGRSLTSSLALRVAGPQALPVNSPATGAPAISGTAQVGETLTADTSDIGDDDGLTNVAFSYQWLANDGTSDTDIAGETDSSYTLAASDEGKTIKVKVTFTDDAGNEEALTSGATDAVAAADPPAEPTGLSATVVSHDTVTITWDDPQDDSITGYVILRRDRAIHPTGTFVTLAGDTGSTDTTYTDETVEPDKEYVYRIKAINDRGQVSEMSHWRRTDTPSIPVPDKPTGLSAVVSYNTVTITWDDPQDDSITGYVILRRDRAIHPTGTFVTITGDTGSADTTYTDDTVEPDKEYVYRIKAINEHGEVSEISDWVRGFTPAAPAPAG